MLTPEEQHRLDAAEAEFDAAGGRGVELAEEIDALRRKRDGEAVTEIRGKIVLADGSTSEFAISEDYGWQQWGAVPERLGLSVPVVEALVAGLQDAEIEIGTD